MLEIRHLHAFISAWRDSRKRWRAAARSAVAAETDNVFLSVCVRLRDDSAEGIATRLAAAMLGETAEDIGELVAEARKATRQEEK
jgi:hypothetical protein